MEKDMTMVSIGDVSRFLNVPTHTIRYWEKEFKEFLSPSRTVGHQRRYTDDDVKKIREIMHLLKIEGYSIAGAKKILSLKHNTGVEAAKPATPMEEMATKIMEMIKSQLHVSAEEKSVAA